MLPEDQDVEKEYLPNLEEKLTEGLDHPDDVESKDTRITTTIPKDESSDF